MLSSESLLVQNLGSERSTANTVETGTEATQLTNEIPVTKFKKLQLPNIEEKLKVKSPQTMTIKKKTKMEEVKAIKVRSSNLISSQPIDGKSRKDRNGVKITYSNKKKVKVTFIDKISEHDLVEVVNIENLKEYNINPFGIPEEHYAKTKHCCSCIII